MFENIERAKALHNDKLNKSNVNFKNTRVTTGERIFVKNGKAVAIGFRNPNIRPIENSKKVGETTSIA